MLGLSASELESRLQPEPDGGRVEVGVMTGRFLFVTLGQLIPDRGPKIAGFSNARTRSNELPRHAETRFFEIVADIGVDDQTLVSA